jgi:DNA modification methylase
VKFENYGRYRLANADCLEAMSWIPANTVDLTVTSPPYDNLRTYNGTLEWGEHVWKPVLEHLFRVTKSGGVVVWIVNDATIKGSETGTSFRQALYAKEVGFNLHDTMIWEKTGAGAVGSNLCYWQNFEFMFVFTKDKIKTFNPIQDRPNVVTGNRTAPAARTKEGTVTTEQRDIVSPEFGRRFNTWKIVPQTVCLEPSPRPHPILVERERCRSRSVPGLRHNRSSLHESKPPIHRHREGCYLLRISEKQNCREYKT